jgi:hypothetical protein
MMAVSARNKPLLFRMSNSFLEISSTPSERWTTKDFVFVQSVVDFQERMSRMLVRMWLAPSPNSFWFSMFLTRPLKQVWFGAVPWTVVIPLISAAFSPHLAISQNSFDLSFSVRRAS